MAICTKSEQIHAAIWHTLLYRAKKYGPGVGGWMGGRDRVRISYSNQKRPSLVRSDFCQLGCLDFGCLSCVIAVLVSRYRHYPNIGRPDFRHLLYFEKCLETEHLMSV